ncbi:putative mediated genome instability protein rmi1 protein [Diplogelasinospora grovesii]|uniref:Mediated genome instability protein rmi1 protein n=1 Tax=Diplogelasinospora grovesii TaxID=303347 RepID=A0AAN6S6N3_9PEZI|nr:putative mediated genome instability protein rmi1 protein [Diplogelasinospora grovesii]
MDLSAQISSSLKSQSLPVPSQSFLTGLISSRNPPPPLASLVATARTRLLCSDLTSPNLLDPGWVADHSFPTPSAATTTSFTTRTSRVTVSTPAAAAAAEVKETRLSRDVIVQVLDIENLSRSRWEQVEELEAIERGEQTRGREVIRLPTSSTSDETGLPTPPNSTAATQAPNTTTNTTQPSDPAVATGRNATHKLILQDSKGTKLYAIELKRVERIAIGKVHIGEKILLKSGTTVARGVVLLEPEKTVVLGGKVDVWHRTWVEGRLARLKEGAKNIN